MSIFNVFFLLLVTLNCNISYSSEETVGRIRIGNLDVVKLQGSSYDIGFQTGEFSDKLAFQADNGMISYMSDFLMNLLMNQPEIQKVNDADLMLPIWLSRNYYKKLEKQIPQDDFKFIDGLSKSTGIEVSKIRNAILNPDVVEVLMSDAFEGRLDIPNLAPKPPEMGCETVMVPGNLTADGKLIIGRVQDYSGAGIYDKLNTIYYIKKDGSAKHVLVSTAGISTGAITAMNEYGLVLSLHSGLSKDTDIQNTPGLITTQKMIEQAKNIDEATAICNQYVPASGWIINLADTLNGKARMGWIEVMPRQKKCVLTMANQEEPLATTNNYRTTDAMDREIVFGPNFSGSSKNRLQRAYDFIHETVQNKKFETTDMMLLLSDRYDNETKTYSAYSGHTIAVSDQIVSALFKPETLEFWVSDGQVPTSGQGHYRHFFFSDLENLSTLTSNLKRASDVDIQTVLKGTPQDLTNWPGFSDYILAISYLDSTGNYSPGKAMEYLKNAVALEPQNALLHGLKAMVHMKLGQLDEAALEWKTTSIFEATLSSHHRAVFKLMQAKTLDVKGLRADAVSLYTSIISDEHVFKAIKTAAKNYLKLAATNEDILSTTPDCKYIDVFKY